MAYSGRRGPNVSQYVANLNTIPPAQEPIAEPLNIDEDLALFTNSEFIDWDGSFDINPPLDFLDADPSRGVNASGTATPAQPVHKNTNKPLDFGSNGMFNFLFCFVLIVSLLRQSLSLSGVARFSLPRSAAIGPRTAAVLAHLAN